MVVVVVIAVVVADVVGILLSIKHCSLLFGRKVNSKQLKGQTISSQQ